MYKVVTGNLRKTSFFNSINNIHVHELEVWIRKNNNWCRNDAQENIH